MAIVDGTTTDGLIMKSLLTNRRNCPLEETFPSRVIDYGSDVELSLALFAKTSEC